MKVLHQIDGSSGEGGGQILRTSLTMSMVTGIPVQIKNIRSGRNKPGLQNQHLACVHAAQAISKATVHGVKKNSQQLVFQPNAVEAGEYQFKIGTAGSTALVMQTVVPALMLAGKESILHFEGGTHNPWAPSFDFIANAYLPMLKRMGIDIEVKIDRYGFFPHGGGRWSAIIKAKTAMQRLEVLERGDLLSQEAVISASNIASHIPQREITALASLDWPKDAFKSEWVEAIGAGNIVSLRLFYQNCSEVIESIGRRGLRAEKVSMIAINLLQQYLSAKAPIGEYLADQLLLPMVIGHGGVFRTSNPSLHTLTNKKVIESFTDQIFLFNKIEKGIWEISL
ncbi:MAG: RNA 3'-terminal phosphate cyclase [Cocleimonas sp.]|nr:RNA 3'-terminal phosphate cyclase [Cocleimonas sp.]